MLFPPNLSANHAIVTTGQELEAMVKELSAAKTVAWDFETAGLRWWDGQLPIGTALGYQTIDGPRAWYVPHAHQTTDTQCDPVRAQEAFEAVMKGAEEIVGHNLKFDLNQARAAGWEVPTWTTIHDTMIQAVLIDETRPKGLERRVALLECSPYGDAQKMKDAVNAWIAQQCKRLRLSRRAYLDRYGHAQVPVPLEGEYACRDIGHTLALHKRQRRSASGVGADPSRRVLYDNEMLLVRALADMEFVGQAVDGAYLERIKLQVQIEMDQLGDELQRAFGCELAWNNDRQMRELLYSRLGFPATRLTSKGQPSVDKAALTAFVSEHTGVTPLMEWRARYKIMSTYTDSLIEKCDSNGRVHPQFNQAGAASGRLSSSAPNFQNIPSRHPVLSKLVRRAFPVDPKTTRIYCDYSQIELRLLAWITGNATLNRAYASDAYEAYRWGQTDYDTYRSRRQSEEATDIHGLVAQRVFGASPTDSDWKAKRSASKIINFGVPYGGGPSLLSSNPELRLDEQTARKYHAAYHRANPEIEKTRTELLRKMRGDGLSFRNWAGRIKHGKRLDWTDEALRAEEERSMFACLVQGSAAELTRFSIVQLWAAQQRGEMPAVTTSTVHDEIQVDCDESDTREVARAVQKIMENFRGVFGPIPVIADLEVSHTNWADKEDYE